MIIEECGDGHIYLSIMPEKIYIMNEILRDCFYKNSWNIEKVRQHSIFTSQGNYPIKGLHYLIEAISFLNSTLQYDSKKRSSY